MKRHVALTGFMAAGKSTIAKKLARKIGCAVYDIDEMIVAAHGAIDEIFFTAGEAKFREYEYAAIAEVLEKAPGIISVGGGAVTHEPTLQLLKKRTYRIFIKVTPEQVLTRLRRSPRIRPLLGPTPTLAKIRELYTKRMPLYAHADFVVEADRLDSTNVAERITEWMHQKHIAL